MEENQTVVQKGIPKVSQNQVEMPGDQSCCLNCAVKNADYKKLKNYLDMYGLSDSQALFLGYDLLSKALETKVDWFRDFFLEGYAKANSKSESKSETPLFWNGTPLCHAVGTSSIDIIESLLKENDVVDELKSHDYLGLLQMAAQLDTEIAQVLLDHLDQNEIQPRCAVVMNNLKTIKSLVHTHIDGTHIDSFYNTSIVIRMATQLAKKQISNVFLKPLSFNKSPLYTAAELNNTDSMEMLLLENANVEERSYNELTPLHIAARLGNTRSAKMFLDVGADTNSVCASALDALVIAAVEDDDEALVELLMRKGVKINTMTNFGCTLLELAARRPHLKVAKLLLNNGFDIDARDKSNKNLLYHAIRTGNFPAIEMIIEYRSKPESPMGETQTEIFEDLVRYGFGVNSDDKNEWYLYEAIRSGCLKIVEYLLTLDTNVNTKCTVECDTTPLHLAIVMKHIEIAKLLIKNNADVNGKDQNGATPLHYACSRLCVDFDDKYWGTSLCATTRTETEEIIKILLNNGATVNTKEIDGKTALHFAVHGGNATAVKLLIENGADVADRNNDGETSLHIAAAGNSSEIVETLLNVFDDVDCRDGGGKTALQIAVENRNAEIVGLLLDHNSDINLLSNCFAVYSQDFANHRIRYDNDSDDPDDNGLREDWNEDRIDFIRRREKETAIILKHHIVKMIALSHCLSEKYLKVINNDFVDYKRVRDQCKDERECMRQTKIGVSDVSYYDVLTKGTNQLTLYVKNKDIVDGLNTGDHKHMFPLYSAMLYHRFKNGQKRAGLLDLSLKSFNFLTGYVLPELPTIELLDYLSNEDLKNLIKAAPCNESDD